MGELMPSVGQIYNGPTVSGLVVADGIIHPHDWKRGNRSVVFAGRVIHTATGIEVFERAGVIRPLRPDWRQIVKQQGQTV